MTARVLTWWDGLDDDGRAVAHGLLGCVALFLFHYAWYSAWYVEDAAITFAFARNASQGAGFVAYVGGEPVEGFSNPTWTLLLTVSRLLGLGPWTGAKLYGALFGALTLWGAHRWAREALPEGRWSLLAPLLLAVSPQHVNWCASGLENGLFGFLLTAGSVALLREVREGGRPWSALWFAGLAATRPEAPMYVAVAGTVGGVFALRQGVRPALRWAVVWGLWLAVPLLLWHAWRFWYFAWPFPNTYYAKLAEADRFLPWSWDRRGWAYLRGWALGHGRGFLLPLFVVAVTGVRGWRGGAGGVLSALLLGLVAAGVSWPFDLAGVDPWTEPGWLVRLRVAYLVFLAALVPAIGVDRRGDAPRILAWALACAVVFFAVYSGGDWMVGWRWVNLGIVPISLLLTWGLAEIAAPLRPGTWLRRGVLGLTLGTLVITDVVQALLLVFLPVTTPYDVHRRVLYVQQIRDRLGLDHAAVMDVDMGAHLWWYGPEIVDMAGLIDVPMGHHAWELPFVGQYVYEERTPEFAHVHASWASRTRMRLHDAWDRYREIPPFPASRWSQHPGNHVRRDLYMQPRQRGGASLVRFGGKVDLVDFEIPAPAVAPGGELYVEVAWQRVGRGRGFRPYLFLTDGERVSIHELPPAYDWEPFRRWRKTEAAIGRHRIPVPADWPEGVYDVGLFALGGDGDVWTARGREPGWMTHEPSVVPGEVRRVRAVRLVSPERAEAAGEDAASEARDLLAAGACEAGRDRWRGGRHHVSGEAPWREETGAAMAEAIAVCFAERARTADRASAVADLREARRWSPRNRRLRVVGAARAEEWVAEADAAWAGGDAQAAYPLYRDALWADPRRTWVRRRAEEVRDALLGLPEDGDEEEDG